MFLCKKFKKTSNELNNLITERENKRMSKAFSSTPFSERIVFVPHCMRNIQKCKAQEKGSYYICVECGGCSIGAISKKTKELGYKAIFVLKGGKAIRNLIAELQPKALVGIACFFEGVQGIEESKKNNIAVQFVPLTKDGCVDTDTNLTEVFKILGNTSKK